MSGPFASSSEKKAVYSMERRKGRTLRVLNTHEKQTHDKHIQFLEKQKQRSKKVIDLECDGYYNHLEQHFANLYPNTPRILLEEIRSQQAVPSCKTTNISQNITPATSKHESRQGMSPSRSLSITVPFIRSKTMFERNEIYEEAYHTEHKRLSLPEPVNRSNKESLVSPNKAAFESITEGKIRSQERWERKCKIPLKPMIVALPSQRKTLLLRCNTNIPKHLNTSSNTSNRGNKNSEEVGQTINFIPENGDENNKTDEVVESNENVKSDSCNEILQIPTKKEEYHGQNEDNRDYSHLIYSSVFCLPPVHRNIPRPLVTRSWSPPPRDHPKSFKELKFCRYLRRCSEF